jgi:hypothetical protein
MIHRYSIKGVEMNCKQLTAVGFTEGFLVLAPTAAFATTGTSTPSAPTSPTASPTRDPVGPTAVALSAHRGGPGAKVKIFVTCDQGSYLSSPAMTTVKDDFNWGNKPGEYDIRYLGTVKPVRPGTYEVNLRCHHRDGNFDTFASDQFVVLPPQLKSPPAKQVAKVPAGAPATGGGGSYAPASSGQG